MNVSAILTRITSQCPGFAFVGHALTSDHEYNYPAAFLTPVRRVAEFPRMLGYHAQMTRQTFGVYVVVRRAAGTDPDLIDDLCAELRTALIDWTPGGDDQPLFYVGGELAEQNGIACWREDFASDVDLRD